MPAPGNTYCSDRFAMMYLRPLCLLLLLPALAFPVQAQEATLIAAVNADGNAVYLYHNFPLSLGEGFNVYRGTPEAKLNEEPLRGTLNAADLPGVLGSTFNVLMDRLEKRDALDLLITLRSNPDDALLFSYLYPEVGLAVGQLYIDSTATIGQLTTYRIEIVDEAGDPTGPSFSVTDNLTPTRPEPPANLSAENDGRNVKLTWQYPQNESDQVLQFRLYRQTDAAGTFAPIHDRAILRNLETAFFSFNTTVPATGGTEVFRAVAVRLGNQESNPADVELVVADNVPPLPITQVEVRKRSDTAVVLTWPVSIDLDAAGYHVYRGVETGQPFDRLTDAPLDLLETIYIDSTLVQGTSFLYRVTAIDSTGNESEPSTQVVTFLRDNTPPPAPANLTGQVLPDQRIQLNWAMPETTPDLASFVVMRKLQKLTADPFVTIKGADLLDTAYADSALINGLLPEGETVAYAVAAMDQNYNYSDTVTVALQIPNVTPPDAPEQVTALRERALYVDVTWSPSFSGDVVGYQVFRQADADASVEVATLPATALAWRDLAVEVNRRYLYHVVAVDSVGLLSVPAVADTVLINDGVAPARVRGIRIRPAPNGGNTLTWARGLGNDVTAYRIYRTATIPTGVYTRIGETPAPADGVDEVTWTDPNGTAASWYKVTAVDTSGNESDRSDPVDVYDPNAPNTGTPDQ